MVSTHDWGSASSPIDITGTILLPEGEQPGGSLDASGGSLGDADPELTWALEQSLAEQPGAAAALVVTEEQRLFRAAVAAAERGSVTPIRTFVDAGGDLSRPIATEDAAAAQLSSSVPKSTLLDVALHRSHQHVVMEILGGSGRRSDLSEASLQLHRRRRLSEGHEESAASARRELRGGIAARADGLVCFTQPSAAAYSLPAGATAAARHVLLEASDRTEQLEEALGWWNAGMAPRGHELVALYTPGDLNCLLHALSLSISGVSDSPAAEGELGALRWALAASLHQCGPLRERLASEAVTADSLAVRAAADRQSLYREHISALASVLRRPLVVYAPKSAEHRLQPGELAVLDTRISGVYLPLDWAPEQCCRSPLALAFTDGHFSAVVRGLLDGHADGAMELTFEQTVERQRLWLPAVDEEGTPLPVGPPWALSAEWRAVDELALLGHFADVEDAEVEVAGESGAVRCLSQDVGGMASAALEFARQVEGEWQTK